MFNKNTFGAALVAITCAAYALSATATDLKVGGDRRLMYCLGWWNKGGTSTNDALLISKPFIVDSAGGRGDDSNSAPRMLAEWIRNNGGKGPESWSCYVANYDSDVKKWVESYNNVLFNKSVPLKEIAQFSFADVASKHLAAAKLAKPPVYKDVVVPGIGAPNQRSDTKMPPAPGLTIGDTSKQDAARREREQQQARDKAEYEARVRDEQAKSQARAQADAAARASLERKQAEETARIKANCDALRAKGQSCVSSQ